MSRRRIRIDHLEIRLRGISPDVARSAVDGLGQNLLDQLSRARNFSAADRPINIGRINSGTLQVANGTRPDQLRSTIGERIVNSIHSKLK